MSKDMHGAPPPSLRLITDVSERESSAVRELYKDAGWWQEDWDPSFIAPMIQGSFLAAGAFEAEKLIGMGRVLSDGVSDAYIQDVVVARDFRHRGIGSLIITFLVTELQHRGVDWIGLVGEPGTAKFYAPLGFEEMKNFIPMRFTQ